MNTPPSDDLLWTAFQYSVGELPTEEEARFEARLEHEAAAQRALAEAVALHEGVRLAEQPAEVQHYVVARRDERSSWQSVAGWVTVATAACLALWFATAKQHPRGNEVVQEPTHESQRALAMAWLDGQPTDDVVLVEALSTDEDELADLESMPSMTEPTAPDWLIAALVDAQSSPLRGEN